MSQEVHVRTRYYPRTKKRPYGRVVAAVVDGPWEGYKETFRWDGEGAHLRAAQRLAQLAGIRGAVTEDSFRDTGSTFTFTT